MATYFVSTTGNDTTGTGSQSSPYRTLNKGASRLIAGDILIARGGVYTESLINKLPSGISTTIRTVFKNYSGETVWLHPPAGIVQSIVMENRNYIELDGINVDGANTTSDLIKFTSITPGCTYIRIKNAELKNTTYDPNATYGGAGVNVSRVSSFIELINLKIHHITGNNHGIYFSASNSLIDGCEIYDVVDRGISNHNSYGILQHDNIIRNNKIYDCHRSGMILRGDRILAYNNVVFGNGATDGSGGIQVDDNGPDGHDNQIYNNTIYGNKGNGITLVSVAINHLIRNNIIYGNSGQAIVDGGTGTVKSNNITVNPLFVGAGTDFHLQSGSPARGAGVNLTSVFNNDLDNNERPTTGAWDAGAYMYGGTNPPPPPPPPIPDTTPPIINITFPSEGVTLSGTVILTLAATD